MLAATYLIYMSKTQCHRVLHGVFKGFYCLAFAENALVLVSFANDHHLSRSLTRSQWTKQPEIASL